MFKLGKSSKVQYETLHKDLRILIDEALKYSSIDFTIVEGHRPPEKQFEYYKQGRREIDGTWVIVDKSKVITYMDGYDRKGKHNYDPSRAFDFCAYVPYKSHKKYDTIHMAALGHMFAALGKKLYEEGKINHKIRWGANWDMDGEIVSDESFVDLPHVEII